MFVKGAEMEQLAMFDADAGAKLRDAGMQRAIDHADRVHGGTWAENAYSLLLSYASGRSEFLAEDYRAAAIAAGLPTPPDLRAFGAVMVRAARSGVIRRIGFGTVKNKRAHRSICTIWGVVND